MKTLILQINNKSIHSNRKMEKTLRQLIKVDIQMINKHLIRHLNLIVTKEMLIKTRMRYHYISPQQLKLK